MQSSSLDELAVLGSWTANIDPYTVVEKCELYLAITKEIVNPIYQLAKDYLAKNSKSRL